MEISMLLQRIIVDGAMVDLEALTVQRGRLAWTLYLDIHVLCHAGNLIDCAVLASMAALTSFRLPQTEVTPAGDVSIFPASEREPLPLTIRHIPFAVSFALFAEGDVVAMDPSREEHEAAQGTMTVLMSEYGELCGIHKVEGCPVSLDTAMRCVRLATKCATGLGATLQEALKVHAVARVYSRVRQVAGGTGTSGQVVGSTAKAAEQVHAARLRSLASASGEATLPRREVTQAVPVNQLPNLGALAVDQHGKGAADSEAAQGHAVESIDVVKAQKDSLMGAARVDGEGKGSARTQVVDADLQGRTKTSAFVQNGGDGGRGQGGVVEGKVEKCSDSMDEDDVHPGIGVRSSGAKAQREIDASPGRKKPKKSGSKRSSPGQTSTCVDVDTFEDIAQLISGTQKDGEKPLKLASCVKSPKKKRKE
jgi:ribonuclease PH